MLTLLSPAVECSVLATLTLVVEVEATAHIGLGKWQDRTGIELCQDGGMLVIGQIMLKETPIQ
jgi:hypothetical protein